MASALVLANIFGGWGIVELGLLLMVGLLIFGKRLPEVGRSLGKSITEFKKGMTGVADSVTGEAPIEPTVTSANTRPSTAQLPTAETQEQRVARLTAELASVKEDMAKQKQTESA